MVGAITRTWLIDMDNLNLSAKQKNILFVILLFVILCILGIVFTAVENSGKYTLTLTATPHTATFSINNVRVSNRTLLYPGVYEVTAEAKGFASITQTITVRESSTVYTPLIPVSDEAKTWSNKNANLYDEGYDPNMSYHPIQNQLPYKDSIFSIDARDVSVEKEVITLDITALPGYRNTPINKILAMGYSPEDYLYNFNYKNPFENE